MTESSSCVLPAISTDQRRAATGQFERANQVISTGNHDYGIQLLRNCCQLDPGNLVYRQALRRAEKMYYKNNLRGSRLSFLTSSPAKTKLKAARASRDYLRVLEVGEEVLARNPWDVGTQLDMAEAAESLGLIDLAVWTLEQARQKDPRDLTVNRALARLYERRGNFSQAIGLWDLVRKTDPRDNEAHDKAKDLAASDTIARGNYESVVGSAGTAADVDTAPSMPALNGTGTKDANPSPNASDRVEREAAEMRKRIENDSTNPLVYLQLAGVYRRSSLFDQARAVLEEGLAAIGNDFELSLEIADLDIEPFRRNLEITDEKLRSSPEDENLRRLRIQFLREINSRELELYRQKSERFPTEMAHRLELGIRLLRAGQTDAAIIELQAARSDPRQRWRSLMYLGYCFKNRRNWRLAQRNFEEAIQNMPAGEETTRKELLFQLAQGCAESGDLSRAVELAYDLANLDFGYRDISRLLDEWQEQMQNAKAPRA